MIFYVKFAGKFQGNLLLHKISDVGVIACYLQKNSPYLLERAMHAE